MTVKIGLSGAAADAVARVVPQLISDLVASRITSGDAALWGPAAEDEAGKRLGWVEAVAVSRPMVDDILALRDALRAKGIDHIVLGGMGGSSLAPEVITRRSSGSTICSAAPTAVAIRAAESSSTRCRWL